MLYIIIIFSSSTVFGEILNRQHLSLLFSAPVVGKSVTRYNFYRSNVLGHLVILLAIVKSVGICSYLMELFPL